MKVRVITSDGKDVCCLSATSVRQLDSYLEIVYDGGPMQLVGKDLFGHPGEFEKFVAECWNDEGPSPITGK